MNREHRIEVYGIDYTGEDAGVGVWCETCDVTLIDTKEPGDVLTPEQIAEAVAAHRARPIPPGTSEETR